MSMPAIFGVCEKVGKVYIALLRQETEAMWEQRRRENAIVGKRVPTIRFNVSAATTKKSQLT